MHPPLHEALQTIEIRCRRGKDREHALVALAWNYELLRDRSSVPEVRRGLSGTIHRIWRLAQRETDRK
jgi:hypothetical protein